MDGMRATSPVRSISRAKFVPGAIAAHIHSYSASTLRDKNSGWAGPLVSRGAAATVGNAYEPYLELTAHLDILNDRLLHGFTFAESVFMSSRGLSWMGVAVEIHFVVPISTGHRSTRKLRQNPPPDGARIMISRSRTGDLEPSDYRTQARTTAGRTGNAAMLEDIGLMEMRDGKFSTAIATLEQARAPIPSGMTLSDVFWKNAMLS
jgi:hypothetical protein